MAVYAGLLEFGDRILALNLNGGGHLSHGASVSLTGQNYEVKRYAVDPETGALDYESIEKQAREFDPDLVVSGYSAYPRTVDWERMQEIADVADAYHMADIAHITGLVAAGEHPSPVGVADVVTGSTHKTIRSGRGGMVLTNDEELASAIDSAVFPGIQGGPLMHNIAGKAVGFKQALEPEFEEYAAAVVANANAMAEQFIENGLSPVSGGTDIHLVLLDLRESHPDVSGLEAHQALEDAGIVANRNRVPDETRPREWSGLRVGTAAVTDRGLDADDCREVADLITRVLDNIDDEDVRATVRERIQEFCDENSVYE